MFRGLGLGLIALLVYSYAYTRFLQWLALRRATDFFWPGFLAGVVGFVALSILFQYSRAASAGVPFADVSIRLAILWSVLPAIAASWLASRSTLKAYRFAKTEGLSTLPTLRIMGAFWAGMGIVLIVLLVGDIARFARR